MADFRPRKTRNKKARETDDSESWLDRNKVMELLNVTHPTIISYERRGLLHPRRVMRFDKSGTERLMYVYDPHELAAIPRPQRVAVVRTPGEIEARCFELLDLGKSVREIVIELRETTETIVSMRERWLDHGGADRVITPIAWDQLVKIFGPFASIAELVDIAKKRTA